MEFNHMYKGMLLMSLITMSFVNLCQANERWQGLVVEPENRCAPYDKKDYPYSQSVEDDIVESMSGRVYGPYTGSYFDSDTKTDIEHMVATSEAHDSGLCSAPDSVKAEFASDLLNLTLAAPKVNRCSASGKCGLDAAEWMPNRNKCWFVNRIILVKQKYKLSVDRAEVAALGGVLSSCDSFELIYHDAVNTQLVGRPIPNYQDTPSKYDDNRNGKISCKEARSHGIAPVRRGDEAYKYMSDRDGDGIVCE